MKKWASVEKKGGVYFIPMGPLVFNEQFPNSWMLDQCVSQNLAFTSYTRLASAKETINFCPQVAFEPGRPTC